MRRILAHLIQFAAVTLVIALLWGGWYLRTKGFGRKSRNYLTGEFRKRGVEFFCDRLTLDPFRGIVAENVRIEDESTHEKTWALIDQIVIDINYSNLLHHQPFLEALDLRDAHLSIPIDPAHRKSGTAEISHLNAHLLLPPHEAYLREATADVGGIHIFASGRLANPEAYHPAGSSASGRRGGQVEGINAVLAEIGKLQFESGAPQLDIRFSGDLAEPENIFVEATLWGEKIIRDKYRIQSIYAAMSFRDGILELKRGTATDSAGTMEATGEYALANHRLAFQVRSSLDLQQLAHAFHLSPLLEECVFYTPPQLELNAETAADGDKGPAGLRVTGHLSLNRFACKSVLFDRLSADFAWGGGRWYLSDFHLDHQTGSMQASALALPGDFQAKITSNVNPRTFLPFLSGEIAKNLGDWDFRESPEVSLTARGSAPDFDLCEAKGEIKLGRTLMRGVPMNGVTAGLLIKQRAVTYENFKLDRDEGTGTGSYTYDFARHEARLDQIKTTLNPADVAVWIDPNLAHSLQPYRFKHRPSLSINGVVDCAGGGNTNLEVLLDGSGGMDYTFIKRNLSFAKITGKLLFTDDRLQLIDIDASLFDGHLRGNADITLGRKDPVFEASMRVEDVDFETLTRLYFDYADSHGLLDGQFDFTGRGDDPRALRGHGLITILDGNVFAIPVLGPFSGILNDIVPGMGYNVAHKGECNFEVQDGVFQTKDLLVKGQGFSMIGAGKLYFVEDKMDFNIRLNAQGIPGVLLFPVSKLLEYGSDGSMSKPVWHPKRLPAFNRNS